jgi:precorrin-2/cobalt-factor-2 C20-methyltransferase
MGPGDPELLTFKAARIIASVPVVAYFAKAGEKGHARCIAEGHFAAGTEEMRFTYPVTVELPVADPAYHAMLTGFYADCASRIADRLGAGQDVALLCEGDPFLYGSAMYIYDRIAGRFPAVAVPGVPGMSGCWSSAGLPMTHGDDVLSVLPGTLSEQRLAELLSHCDAAVIMKVGRNLAKIRAALVRAGRAERAVYAERGTMTGERILPLAAMDGERAPYFSMILVPGRQRTR